MADATVGEGVLAKRIYGVEEKKGVRIEDGELTAA